MINDYFLSFMIGLGKFLIIFYLPLLVLLLLYGEGFPYVIRDKIKYRKNMKKRKINSKGEIMAEKKTQEFLKEVKLTGQTNSGEIRTLDTEVKVQSSKVKIEAEQEYILINKLSEAGIEIKARFMDEGIPTDKAKFLFMFGEACYAAAFKFYASKSDEVETSEQREKLFENFMGDLTERVKIYHRLDKK